MKKRVKLLTTIASLCLAVALMAFGVYAANGISGQVTSSVSFSATENVKATLTYSNTLTGATAANYTAATDEEWAELTGLADDAIDTLELGALELTPNDGATEMVYSYTIKIQNNATANDTYSNLKVTLSAPNAVTETGYSVEVIATDFTENVATVAAGDSVSYTVKITVNAAISLEEAVSLNSTVTLNAVE